MLQFSSFVDTDVVQEKRKMLYNLALVSLRELPERDETQRQTS